MRDQTHYGQAPGAVTMKTKKELTTNVDDEFWVYLVILVLITRK
jgi:hypothetical protein